MTDPVHAETGVDAATMAFGAVAALLARQPFDITLPVPGRPRNWPLPPWTSASPRSTDPSPCWNTSSKPCATGLTPTDL